MDSMKTEQWEKVREAHGAVVDKLDAAKACQDGAKSAGDERKANHTTLAHCMGKAAAMTVMFVEGDVTAARVKSDALLASMNTGKKPTGYARKSEVWRAMGEAQQRAPKQVVLWAAGDFKVTIRGFLKTLSDPLADLTKAVSRVINMRVDGEGEETRPRYTVAQVKAAALLAFDQPKKAKATS